MIWRIVKSLNVLKSDLFSYRQGWVCCLERVFRARIWYWSHLFLLNRGKVVSFWNWSFFLSWSNWYCIESTFNSAHFISTIIKLDGNIFFNPIDPLPFINATIIPLHLSIPMTVVILEDTNVFWSIFPMINALSIFLIVHVLAFIRIPMQHLPLSFTVPHSRSEHSSVKCSARPVVLTILLWRITLIITNVKITVRKNLQPFPMLLLSFLIVTSYKNIIGHVFDNHNFSCINYDWVESKLKSFFLNVLL